MISRARALTLKQAGKRLGVSAATVRRRIYEGAIEAVNVGTTRYPRLRVTEAALVDYLTNRAQTGRRRR